MTHALQCRCGTLRGQLTDIRGANHAVCYCRSCQAFAHFLGREAEVLDPLGATTVIQTSPSKVVFTQGADQLACMRLTEKGLLRWYAACCRTPVGNTLATPKVSFVGLVHNVLEDAGQPSLDQAFGSVKARVNVDGARTANKPKPVGLGPAILWFLANGVGARFTGAWRRTPFFRTETGEPVAQPQVLSPEEHARLMAEVEAKIG
ncbi:DUF6151 family protein [Phenylobacterium sp.]|jgi:hypothetical protein|uniref:DUF6151 family protein n=1 Tax=Phenylobacterium sp. TaxID=1871053 RepID=UPI002E325779|nr:DUF6151 family protein [Phenylobacterium sp.]HEX2559803.1 DUF6151 family protein [Phenylobacterium sp.]